MTTDKAAMPQPAVYFDDDLNAAVAVLPAGFRFESGPHELAQPIVGQHPPKSWKRWALKEMNERLAGDAVVPCACDDCLGG